MTQETELSWDIFTLPNIPIYQTKLSPEIMNRLWRYVGKSKESYSHQLAGNISQSFLLEDEDNYFMDKVVRPVSNLYVNNDHGVTWIPCTHNVNSKNIVLNKMWVNFQNENEFNPIHDHSGIISFVVWMKIPTEWDEQHNLPFSKGSNVAVASDFQFTYSDILGKHQDYRIQMGGFQEGWMLVFPASLRHQVYPFYNCKEQRVSISGNVTWDSLDLDL